MSHSVITQGYLQRLKRVRANLPEIMYRVQKAATIQAVEAATKASPPKEDTGRGPYIGRNMITGALKQGWEKDSTIEPIVSGRKYTTYLKNNVPYTSYVNDGHRMDRHFVPGLYIDEDGLLSYAPSGSVNGHKVGIVVGTKTKYVKGEFMGDKARKAYETAVETMLSQEIGRLLE